MNLLRRDVRLNDVNWSLVATSLLRNSGYQTDRKIYDQSKMTLRLAISSEPSLTNSRGSRVAGRGFKVAVAGPMSRSRVQSRGRGSNVAAEENDLEFEVTE